ncbi:hypothetical protein BDV96DRAFT_656448 [Lophiotrema nucula]|uniref:Uncharacterized protein n=1 Tax=Lophiotrema nucula TaxID=690887 RepID=A0A6A5ZUM6_9PLEO|nr:hypothetical protein BDV96DRAFT_656448 [Lophiotrema nucula]
MAFDAASHASVCGWNWRREVKSNEPGFYPGRPRASSWCWDQRRKPSNRCGQKCRTEEAKAHGVWKGAERRGLWIARGVLNVLMLGTDLLTGLVPNGQRDGALDSTPALKSQWWTERAEWPSEDTQDQEMDVAIQLKVHRQTGCQTIRAAKALYCAPAVLQAQQSEGEGQYHGSSRASETCASNAGSKWNETQANDPYPLHRVQPRTGSLRRQKQLRAPGCWGAGCRALNNPIECSIAAFE